jgi:uncharacterized protein YcbK (DUF882 family)
MVSAARRKRLFNSVVRIGASLGAAGVLVLAASVSLQNAAANGDTRTLTFHHVHTGEDITITFKRDGRYDEAALKQLDWFMRDWRKSQTTHMDPELFDVLWEVYREIGATKPVDVVCGYRSPNTNAMLRGRSKRSGVAEHSQHTLGHAMDFYVPGVSLEKLREIGMRLQAGGVGFYPSSGSPFVHMDTGQIRHWPRMTYAQLSQVFPDGKTVHVASDGRPLARFAQALTEVEARGKTPNHVSLEQARAHGVITEQQVQTAELVAQKPRQPSLLASLFGGGASTGAAATATPASMPARIASAEPEKPVRTERIVPIPPGRPKAAPVAVADAPGTASPRAANLMAFAAPNALSVDGALVQKLLPFKVASADATVEGALAYAYAPSEDLAPVRGQKWGAEAAQSIAASAPPKPESIVASIGASQTTVAMKAGESAAPANGLQRGDSPWLRAAIMTPSASEQLTVTQFAATDPTGYRVLFVKPTQAVAMRFSEEPSLQTDRFTGEAIVFLARATFVRAYTASLAIPSAR